MGRPFCLAWADSDSNLETVMIAKRPVRAWIYRLLPERLLLAWLFLWKGKRARLSTSHAWATSLRTGIPLDENGAPLPWIPYVASNLLAERLRSTMRVLEFGCGYSTLFLMTRAGSVVSVEHQPSWLEFMRTNVDDNVTLIAAPAEPADAYCSVVTGGDAFDVILIDGQHRLQAFDLALTKVGQDGVIFMDDTQRVAYQPAFARASEAGWKHLHLEGHKPGSVGLYRTTLFYRANNCLNI